jgi:hypothetical protein
MPMFFSLTNKESQLCSQVLGHKIQTTIYPLIPIIYITFDIFLQRNFFLIIVVLSIHCDIFKSSYNISAEFTHSIILFLPSPHF